MSKRDADLLFELGSLRLIQRQWRRFHLLDAQNVTEHHFQVMWLSLIIAAREGVKNTDKIMKMALMHDIGESRTNDVDYVSRQYVDQHEDKAIEDMLDQTSVKDEFTKVWQEYHDRKTIEAKIVKDADNLAVDMELREFGARGHKLEKVWQAHRKELAASNLFTKTARQLYKEIQATEPYNWHTNSPSNRLNKGDWKGKVSS